MSIVLPDQSFADIAEALRPLLAYPRFHGEVDESRALYAVVSLFDQMVPIEPAARGALSALQVPA
jgi:hypothetical protein